MEHRGNCDFSLFLFRIIFIIAFITSSLCLYKTELSLPLVWLYFIIQFYFKLFLTQFFFKLSLSLISLCLTHHVFVFVSFSEILLLFSITQFKLCSRLFALFFSATFPPLKYVFIDTRERRGGG